MLLYLHKQEVLTLNHGMTVMRRAMTIEVNADKKGAISRTITYGSMSITARSVFRFT